MRLPFRFLPCLAIVGLLSTATVLEATSVLSYHNDLSSSGANTTETILTPAILTVNSFSKRFSTPVDGLVTAQPLYMPAVPVTGGTQAGTHDLVFVATQHDSVYAIDASSGVVVWKTSLTASGLSGATSISSVPSGDTGSGDVTPEIGICGTPVIDPTTHLLYVVANTKQVVNGVTAIPHYVFTIYAINVENGNAIANANIVKTLVFADTTYDGTNYTFRTNTSPTAAQDPFSVGTGDGAITVNSQSRVYFNGLRHMNRVGLTLTNNNIYASFGSHGDETPYHGWMLAFNKTTLAVTAVLNLTPNGGLGGIWQSGGVVSVDSSGYFYLITGNGTFDADMDNNGDSIGLNSSNFPQNGDYGDCVVKISTDATTSAGNQNINGWGLKVVDYFAPADNQTLTTNDTDFGSGACIILPNSAGSVAHPHLLVAAGKQGTLYLINRDSMGKFSPNIDTALQFNVTINRVFDTPVFFNGILYYVALNDVVKSFSVTNGVISSSTVEQGTNTYGFPGATPSVSASGTTNGIVWSVDNGTAQLRANQIGNLSPLLWNSDLAPNSRDSLGQSTKFAVPTVADGRVMVGTMTSLVVYAATPSTPPVLATSAATGVGATTATFNGTVDPKGTPSTLFFQFGTTTAYGSTSATQAGGNGVSTTPFSVAQAGLASHTVYHYRAAATYSNGTVFGLDKTFTTLPAPVIESNAASYLSATGAEVSQSVDPNGEITSVYFEYGTTTGYGTTTAPVNIGRGAAAVNVYALLSGLSSGTVYHYRVVTTSVAGTFLGTDQTLTTLPFNTNLVAQKTDAAAGVNGATFAIFGNPAINANDNTAFKATLTLATGLVTTLNDTGIWADDGTGTRQLIAREGVGTAPGTSATFTSFSDPVYNNNDAVAFWGTLKVATGQATLATSTGIWSSSGGSLALVAREGGAAPGTAGLFATFTPMGLTDSNGAVFQATLTANRTTGITAANNIGIWQGDSTANLALLLQLGQTVGGKTITKLTFMPAELYVNGQTRGFAAGAGDIVCGASFSDKTTGIIEVVDGTPSLVARSGDPATGIANATYSLFDSPTINESDHEAFAATVTGGGVTVANNVGIWADSSNGTRNLITRTGSAAPGTSATFAAFNDPVDNNNDAVAFRGTLKIVTGQATRLTDTGIWCNSAGSLALVARQGDQAPGCPTGATFASFTALFLPDQGGASNNGGAIFVATLNVSAAANVTAANSRGIWAVDDSGDLQLIARTGDVLNGKTVTALTFLPTETYVGGQGRSVTQDSGDLVYLATFSDKSTAIYHVIFP